MQYRILHGSKKSAARVGVLTTAHGAIDTPAFMSIATKGAVKGVLPSEVRDAGAHIVLGNTYHLWLRPGLRVIKKSGGLHRFMRWNGPILTDSGGFQVFSLAKVRTITEQGVRFRDPKGGALHLLTPERSMEIQKTLGSDIVMAFDDLIGYPASKLDVTRSMERTTRWAERCLKVRLQKHQALFGIVQGGVFPDLRKRHAAELTKLPFDGFALGGLSVGEPEAKIQKMIALTAPLLPTNKPRYVMGMGLPHQMVDAVRAGIDLFDCVLPTRDARHGRLYVWAKQGRAKVGTTKKFYTTMNIASARFANDTKPVDADCPCAACANFSRAFLRHQFAVQEPLALRLATLHNLAFFYELFSLIRSRIRRGVL